MNKELKKFSIESKLKLSKILEKVEVEFEKKDVANILDNFHKKSLGHVLGITGPPGVGKSSIINKLITTFRNKSLSVGVLAIDPSSLRSGGAFLGDRARLEIDPADPKIFVRSLAAKDFLGGVSELTYPFMIVLRSIFDIVIIETVGVGQSEISIENIADTVIYCVQPGSGDTLQFMKSGIIEIPDIILVTKSDLEKLSNITVSDLVSSKSYIQNNLNWEIEVIPVSSHKNQGFEKLENIISDRWNWLNNDKTLIKKRTSQDIEWIKKSIINQYGTRGFKLIKSKIGQFKNPFNFFLELKKKITLAFKE